MTVDFRPLLLLLLLTILPVGAHCDEVPEPAADDALGETSLDSVRLLPLPAGLLVGEAPVAAEVSGDRIRSVELRVDGVVAGRLEAPAFKGILDLGGTPQRHTLTAVGLDADDRPLAQDQRGINDGYHYFGVRLVEPNPLREFASRGALDVPVEVRVEAPIGQQVERVELFLDDQLVRTLREAPFVDLLSAGPEVSVLRAVAYLDDGRSSEALRLLRVRGELDEIDVQLVEMYVSVTRRREPVAGLERDNFRLLEGDEPQPIQRIEHIDNLPLNVVVLMDNSDSMSGVIADATKSALAFIDSVFTERDRAAFIAFNHYAQLVSPFTNDLQQMRQAVRQLKPEGGTRLYEALIHATYYFEGREGKRALVLLSDGQDQDSHFDFYQMEEFALRSGVAVYTISLENPAINNTRRAHHRARLKRLSENTGGRTFLVSLSQTLDEIYEQIQRELRNQYLLTFHAPSGEAGFREVEVEVVGVDGRVRVLTRQGYIAQ